MSIEQQLLEISKKIKDIESVLERIAAIEATLSPTKAEMPQTSNENELVNLKGAARMTGVTTATIRNKLLQGQLKKYDGEGRFKILVSKRELLRLIDQGEFGEKPHKKRVAIY